MHNSVLITIIMTAVTIVLGQGQPATTTTSSASTTPFPQINDSVFRNIDREIVDFAGGDVTLRGFLARVSSERPRPTVIVVPDRNGRDDYENRRALQLAQLGYVGFAVDVWPTNTTTGDPMESAAYQQAQMALLRQNQTLLVSRLQAALRYIRSRSTIVDGTKVAAIGYCFGGLGVLDMARAGLDVVGVVAFHGVLVPPPDSFIRQAIRAKVLTLNGADDPSASPDVVRAFEDELTKFGADWQLVAYSNTVHAFTVPGDKYNAASDRRSWAAMRSFLAEVFNEQLPQCNGAETSRRRLGYLMTAPLLLCSFKLFI